VQPYWETEGVKLYHADAADLSFIESDSIQCVIVHPPYFGEVDYGLGRDALGCEFNTREYAARLVDILRETKRVLCSDGGMWLVLANSARVVVALEDDDWFPVQRVVWQKRRGYYESADYQDVFLFSKYGPQTNDPVLWDIPSGPRMGNQFEALPEELVERCVSATRLGEVILDPFVGTGTTCYIAQGMRRRAIGVDLHEGYLEIAKRRISEVSLPMEMNVVS
jgi:DNA modification methylase